MVDASAAQGVALQSFETLNPVNPWSACCNLHN